MPFKLLLAFAFLFTSTAFATDLKQENVALSKIVIKAYGTQLKGALKTALETQGPIGGITVCHEQAPAIAQAISEEYDLEIGRTSLKTRNSDNNPDAWEAAVLQEFENRIAAGEDPATMVAYLETVNEEGEDIFRFMKAIPTQGICLICHGAVIDDNLAKTIAEYYPDDKARGFAVGDLRGAFTVTKTLK